MGKKRSNYDETLIEIIKACSGSAKEASDDDLKELKEQLKILRHVTSRRVEKFTSGRARGYWESKGLGTSHYFKEDADYQRAFHAITKILDILRGTPLTITIQKIERDSEGKIIGIATYKGKESNLTLFYNKELAQIEYRLKSGLKKKTATDAYIKHYEDFYRIANDHIDSTEEGNKKVNEGHIVEAFQRHLKNRHQNVEKEINPYSEKITHEEVIVLLYYSTGNTPWWQQGDIGYDQIKNINNSKLASEESIRRVSEKILFLFKNRNNLENFENTFKKMFTAQDLEEITDIDKMTEEAKKELLEKINERDGLKNIPLKI